MRAGKTIEEIAEELEIAIDYVREMDIKMKEIKLKAKKISQMIDALRAGRTAEEVAKEVEMPLEFILEMERKIKSSENL